MKHKQMVEFLISRIGFVALAKKMNVCNTTIYYWRTGDRSPSYHAGKEIERIFRIEERKVAK